MMIVSITTSTGRVVHVAPDNEPVFSHSEVLAMKWTGPETAELIALVKEVFPGGKIETVEHYKPTPQREDEQMALLNFNAAEQEEMRDFELLPAGEYVAAITDSEMCENSARTGHYLKLEFTVIEGECNGRKVFANLNLDNPNAQAVDIARSELKSICSAQGKGNATINDSSELHDIPMIIKIKHEARKDKQGEFSAKICKYAPANGGGAAPSKTANAGAANAARGGKKPWEK